MHLTNVANKVAYSLTMVENIRSQQIMEAGLWYHSVGLMNAYYAICEELKTDIANNKDPILSPIVRNWLTNKKDEINSFFGKDRNTATHQGKISTRSHLIWITDHHHDTDFPQRINRVSVKDSKVITDITTEEFLDIAEAAFNYLKKSIIEFEKRYKISGGKEDLFNDSNQTWDRAKLGFMPNI